MGQEVIGVGRSNNPDPREAGTEAARRAADMLNPAEEPAWVLLFCGGKHDPAAVLAGLRTVVGPLPVVGGSAAGTVTSAGFGYSGFEVAVGLFPASLGSPEILADGGLLEGEAAAGRRLGESLRWLSRLHWWDGSRQAGGAPAGGWVPAGRCGAHPSCSPWPEPP